MFVAATAFLLALALVVGAYASRTDPEPFVGQTGTVEELLEQFSAPEDRDFTSAGLAMLALAAVATLLGSVLFFRAIRRR
jgi:hypothetical protein